MKVVVGTRKRMPVNVKKLASTVVTLGGDYEVREDVWVSSSGHLDDLQMKKLVVRRISWWKF